MTASAVRDWLARDLRPAARRIEARRLDALAIRLKNEGLDLESCRPGESIGYLAEIVREEIAGLDELRRRYVEFAASFGRAMDETEREDLILEFAQSLGASGADLHEDRRALRRWFGYEAVVERFSRREQYAEQTIGFFVERVGSITSAMMRSQSPDAAEALLRETGIEAIATPLLGHSGDERVRIEAFRALTRCLTALPPAVAETAVSARLIQFIYRAALDPGQNIWIQSEALALLLHSSPATFARATRRRLAEPAEGDDLFVRGRAVRLLGGALKAHPELEDCLRVALTDPSPHVRQEIPGSIARSWPEKAIGVLATMLRDDPTPSVRASALLAIPLLVLSLIHI